YARSGASWPTAPQPPQAARATVMSWEKTSLSSPASAFPSTLVATSSISSPRRSEAFGLDRRRRMTQKHQRAGHGLDERRRSANERRGHRRGRPSHVRQHRGGEH